MGLLLAGGLFLLATAFGSGQAQDLVAAKSTVLPRNSVLLSDPDSLEVGSEPFKTGSERLIDPETGTSGGESTSLAGAASGRGSNKLEVVALYDRPVYPFSDYGMALKLTTLGAGFDVVTSLLRNWNLRGSAIFFDFGHDISRMGVDYNGELHLRSGQVSVDWFPKHRGFHISPGVLFFRSRLAGVGSVPGGNTYTLNDQVYTSSPTDPIRSVGQVTFSRRVAPSLMIGFGNIIPRGSKRLTIPVEFGAAYVGAPRLNVRLTGTACQNGDCFNVATDPNSQFNLIENLYDLNEDLKRFQVYPIVSIGVGYRF